MRWFFTPSHNRSAKIIRNITSVRSRGPVEISGLSLVQPRTRVLFARNFKNNSFHRKLSDVDFSVVFVQIVFFYGFVTAWDQTVHIAKLTVSDFHENYIHYIISQKL